MYPFYKATVKGKLLCLYLKIQEKWKHTFLPDNLKIFLRKYLQKVPSGKVKVHLYRKLHTSLKVVRGRSPVIRISIIHQFIQS